MLPDPMRDTSPGTDQVNEFLQKKKSWGGGVFFFEGKKASLVSAALASCAQQMKRRVEEKQTGRPAAENAPAMLFAGRRERQRVAFELAGLVGRRASPPSPLAEAEAGGGGPPVSQGDAGDHSVPEAQSAAPGPHRRAGGPSAQAAAPSRAKE